MKYNRWYIVFGALLIQASLGAIYIYSVFKLSLKSHFPDWSAADLALPSQIVLFSFAVSMIVSGKIHDKIGSKKTAILGAVFLLLGMWTAAKATTLAQFVFGFGVLGGIGIGTAYVCPIAACVKWFPEKRGFITGLAVAGFGAGGLIFTPLANYFISMLGIMPALFYLGLIYFVSIIIGAQFLRLPAKDYCPQGWAPPVAANTSWKANYTGWEMIRIPSFWIIWATYFIGSICGLMVIMNAVNMLQSTVKAVNLGAGEILAMGGFVVMAISIMNSFGRIIWGRISDKNGRERTLQIIFILCGLIFLVLNGIYQLWLFITCVSIIGFCFGGFLALYPAITADYFGTKNIGGNYGLMFTAYGAGGLIGPWLAPILVDSQTGSYGASFLVAGVLCLAALFLISRLRSLNVGQ